MTKVTHSNQPSAVASLLAACPFLEQHRTEYWDCGDTVVFGHVARLLQAGNLSESEAQRVFNFFNELAETESPNALEVLATGAIETFNDSAGGQEMARRFLRGRALQLLEEMRLYWGQPDHARAERRFPGGTL